MSQSNKKIFSGFTIIELMVTIGLMVIVLSVSTVAYRQASKRTEIILTIQQVASNARLMQSYAANAKEYENITRQNIWGVYFDKNNKNQYLLFVDKNENTVYDQGEIYQTLTLNNGVFIDSITCHVNDTQTKDLTRAAITFIPPNPDTVIVDTTDKSECKSISVVLKDNINNSIKELNINFYGLIDINR